MGPISKFNVDRCETSLPSTKERFTSQLKKAKVSMAGVCECESQSASLNLDDGLPKFRTQLYMLQKVRGLERKMNVVFSVYATCYDVYAVVSQDRNIIVKDCGYIKLKNCNVHFDDVMLTLQIVQKNYEGVPLRFKAVKSEQIEQLKRWLQLDNNKNVSGCATPISKATRSYMTSSPRVSPNTRRKTSLPVLCEDEELITMTAMSEKSQTVEQQKVEKTVVTSSTTVIVEE